ncbi:hypothetical protein GCM10022393_08160 [Aquimarina addita]|uniref:Proteinase inhibitor I42 chagasin domain-containing protein n=1 Tax=Aquimarina addita TaxID=870485 RepID=A0ABP7XBU5_9FLAO
MKYFILFIVYIFTIIPTHAQKGVSKKSPEIIAKLMIGKTTYLDNKGVKFIGVVEDSRCPTGVNCIWAGKAKILVGIYENNMLVKEKEITFEPKNTKKEAMQELLVSDTKTIYGYTLSPYPVSGQKKNPSDYFIEILIE